ncbi:hypothetical protein PLANPX_4992 [Lacipirellula parvula]|uniref:Uncharacterized protein n=1 Tax=Lacipirellula parvula TaxID=2650471 RepID=A0A5K7XF04_9BACT|nr:hypothetical protein PLANPX_4992 [Lacipirellula parvula]
MVRKEIAHDLSPFHIQHSPFDHRSGGSLSRGYYGRRGTAIRASFPAPAQPSCDAAQNSA